MEAAQETLALRPLSFFARLTSQLPKLHFGMRFRRHIKASAERRLKSAIRLFFAVFVFFLFHLERLDKLDEPLLSRLTLPCLRGATRGGLFIFSHSDGHSSITREPRAIR